MKNFDLDMLIQVHCDIHGCMPTVICGNYLQLAALASLSGILILSDGHRYSTILGDLGIELDCAAKEVYVK